MLVERRDGWVIVSADFVGWARILIAGTLSTLEVLDFIRAGYATPPRRVMRLEAPASRSLHRDAAALDTWLETQRGPAPKESDTVDADQ